MSCHSFAWGILMLYGTEKLTLPQAKLWQNLMELMISEGDDVIVKAYKCTDEENEGKHRFTTHFPLPRTPITQPALFAVCVVLWSIQSTLPMKPHWFHSSPSPTELPCFPEPPKGFLCLTLWPHLSWTMCSSDGFIVHSAPASKASMEIP